MKRVIQPLGFLIIMVSLVIANVHRTQNISGICGTVLITDDFVESVLENTRIQNPALYQRMLLDAGKDRTSSVTEDTLGTVRAFYVYDFLNKSYRLYYARLMARGNFAQIWADTFLISSETVTQGLVDTILNALENETPIYSRDRYKGIIELENEYLGYPPNYDGDGYTDFLLVDIIDQWSLTLKGNAVLGYFDPRDQSTAPGSNQRDILYIDTNPGLYRNGGKRNAENVLPTVAHELQHLIHYNYDKDELSFVNEGLSEIAAKICGYSMYDPVHYFRQTDVPLFDWDNISENVSVDYSRAALFTLYYDEQLGDSILKKIVQNPENGKAGLDSAFLSTAKRWSLVDLLEYWFKANIIQDRSIIPEFGYKKRLNQRPHFAHYHINPNVSVRDTVHVYAVDYIGFAYTEGFEITFQTFSDDIFIDVIKVGAGIDVEIVQEGTPYRPGDSGTPYTSLVFVVYNFGTQSAIYEYTAIGQVPRWIVYNTQNSQLSDNRINKIIIDKTGKKWLATWGGGLVNFDGFNWFVYNYNTSYYANLIADLDIDNSGTIWVAARKYGLTRIQGNQWYTYGTSNSDLASRYVTCVAAGDAGLVWVGYESAGLSSFDGQNWIHYTTGNSDLPADRVYDLAVEPETQIVWVGTAGGLAAFNGATWQVYTTANSPLPDNAINVIAIDDSNHKWIGTPSGLARFDGTSWTVFTTDNSGLSSNFIEDIAFDDSGNVWIATTTWDQNGLGGLVKFDGSNWTVYRKENSGLPENDVLSVTIDKEGNRWIGTANEGLVLFRKGDAITGVPYAAEPAVPQNFVLYPNFPNPFNPTTTLAFDLPRKAPVTLTVFDILGRKVATVVDRVLKPGHYEIPFDASHLASGVYVFQLKAGPYRAARKMMVLK
ncbi:MAG: T9SS type A sorting domain-containing protein [Calditrichaeota bacterium]|nr:T9SS type A sorting domain-containing protein [Calditrichota bacterium]